MDQYAVIGNPIEHSKSPAIHQAFAEQTQQAMEYGRILGDLEQFEQQVTAFFGKRGKGLNVTVPFKERAYAMCDVLSKRAQRAGAVNTLMVGKNGEIYGDNTDGAGMVRDIVHVLNQPLADKRILVLGAGGAVRGVIEPMQLERPDSITIVNRTAQKAQALGELFNVNWSTFDTLEGEFDIIINGTSASLGGDLPPIPDTVIGANTWCYDMMYGKEPTVFLSWAAARGAKGEDGLGMLVGQAAESFFIWRHVRPDQASIVEQLRQAM